MSGVKKYLDQIENSGTDLPMADDRNLVPDWLAQPEPTQGEARTPYERLLRSVVDVASRHATLVVVGGEQGYYGDVTVGSGEAGYNTGPHLTLEGTLERIALFTLNHLEIR